MDLLLGTECGGEVGGLSSWGGGKAVLPPGVPVGVWGPFLYVRCRRVCVGIGSGEMRSPLSAGGAARLCLCVRGNRAVCALEERRSWARVCATRTSDDVRGSWARVCATQTSEDVSGGAWGEKHLILEALGPCAKKMTIMNMRFHYHSIDVHRDASWLS